MFCFYLTYFFSPDRLSFYLSWQRDWNPKAKISAGSVRSANNKKYCHSFTHYIFSGIYQLSTFSLIHYFIALIFSGKNCNPNLPFFDWIRRCTMDPIHRILWAVTSLCPLTPRSLCQVPSPRPKGCTPRPRLPGTDRISSDAVLTTRRPAVSDLIDSRCLLVQRLWWAQSLRPGHPPQVPGHDMM